MIEGEVLSIVGVVTRRSNEAYADGWGFATVVAGGRDYKIVGSIGGITLNMTVCVEGTVVKHPTYGIQIKVVRIWEDDPKNEAGMISWMSKRLPQIGPKRAAEIIRKFGVDKMFHVIEYEPYRLKEIDGITEERTREIIDAYAKYKREQETFIGLYRLGFNKTETNRIMRVWQEDPLEALSKNPFELYGAVQGFTFKRLDEIRDDVGLPEDHPPRLETALVDRAKRRCQERGHTVTDFDDFVLDVADWIEQDEELMMEHLGDMVKAHQLAFFGRGVMLYTLDADEEEISTKIKELLRVGRDRRAVSDALIAAKRVRAGSNLAAGLEPSTDPDIHGGGSAPEAERGDLGNPGDGGADDSVDLDSAGQPVGAGAQGAAPGVNPDDSAFNLGYWGGQGRGVFDPGQGAGSSQGADAHGANGGGDGRAGNGKDHNPETDA